MASSVVMAVLALSAAQLVAGAEPVKVDFYGESLCPYCETFLVKFAAPLFQKGLDSLMTFRYIPYGNARIINGTVHCQHGPLECKVDAIFSCVIDAYPDPKQWFPYVKCVESSTPATILDAVTSCASSANIDLASVLKCATGPEGVELQKRAAEETNSLKPSHTYVPWVVVNGIPLEDSFESLLKYLCVAFEGERPAACFELSGGSTNNDATQGPRVCRRDEAVQQAQEYTTT